MYSYPEISRKITTDFATIFRRRASSIHIARQTMELGDCDVIVELERIYRMWRGMDGTKKTYKIDIEGTVMVRLDSGCGDVAPGYLTDCVEVSEDSTYDWQDERISGGQASISFRLRGLEIVEQDRTSPSYEVVDGHIEQLDS